MCYCKEGATLAAMHSTRSSHNAHSLLPERKGLGRTSIPPVVTIFYILSENAQKAGQWAKKENREVQVYTRIV